MDEAIGEPIAEPVEEAEPIEVIGLWEPLPVIIGVSETIGDPDIMGLLDMPAEPVEEAGWVADEEWQAERVSVRTAAAPAEASRLAVRRVRRVRMGMGRALLPRVRAGLPRGSAGSGRAPRTAGLNQAIGPAPPADRCDMDHSAGVPIQAGFGDEYRV
jgi:hypothetical protein